ncbi:MAG: hypothetical protein ACYTG2_13950 [Planctomycetota bacterium]|jgi:hypothetical protein
MKTTLRFITMLALAAPAVAQANYTVGPQTVPSGARVSVTLSNDTTHKLGVSAPLYEVYDAEGGLVYVPTDPVKAVLMASGGHITFYWDLIDQAGEPVPTGEYTLQVKYDTFVPPTAFPVEVVRTGAGLVFEGTATTQVPAIPGYPRHFYLHSPEDGGQVYMLLASLTSTIGIATCGGPLPLDLDPVFSLSLVPDTVFQNSVGTLDASGRSYAPRFDLPSNPALIGLTVHSAYVVFDPGSGCQVRRISNLHTMTIH